MKHWISVVDLLLLGNEEYVYDLRPFFDEELASTKHVRTGAIATSVAFRIASKKPRWMALYPTSKSPRCQFWSGSAIHLGILTLLMGALASWIEQR